MSKCKAVLDGNKITAIQVKTKEVDKKGDSVEKPSTSQKPTKPSDTERPK